MAMRRTLTILLMLAIALPIFAFAFGSARAGDLPACCRRMGAHHCMEMVLVAPGRLPLVHMTCLAYPRRAASLQTGAWSASLAGDLKASTVERSSLGQVEAGFRVSSGRARQKRGPPSRES